MEERLTYGGGLVRASDLVKGSKLRRNIKSRGKIKHIICCKGSSLCFLITDDKVIMQTSLQSFRLDPLEVPGDLWRRRLRKIRVDILARRITNRDQLLVACGSGIVMVPTRLYYHV